MVSSHPLVPELIGVTYTNVRNRTRRLRGGFVRLRYGDDRPAATIDYEGRPRLPIEFIICMRHGGAD